MARAPGSLRREVSMVEGRREGSGRTRSGAFLRSIEQRRAWAYWR